MTLFKVSPFTSALDSIPSHLPRKPSLSVKSLLFYIMSLLFVLKNGSFPYASKFFSSQTQNNIKIDINETFLDLSFTSVILSLFSWSWQSNSLTKLRSFTVSSSYLSPLSSMYSDKASVLFKMTNSVSTNCLFCTKRKPYQGVIYMRGNWWWCMLFMFCVFN